MEDRSEISVVVRAADPDDVSPVTALNRFVQDLHVAARPDVFHPGDLMPDVQEFFRALLRSQTPAVFVAEIDDRVVGYVHVEVQRRGSGPFARGYDRLYVHQISVDPEFRRLGVGRSLMSRATEIATELELDSIALDTWSFNAEAQRFFEGLGFSIYNLRLSRPVEETPDPDRSTGTT